MKSVWEGAVQSNQEFIYFYCKTVSEYSRNKAIKYESWFGLYFVGVIVSICPKDLIWFGDNSLDFLWNTVCRHGDCVRGKLEALSVAYEHPV